MSKRPVRRFGVTCLVVAATAALGCESFKSNPINPEPTRYADLETEVARARVAHSGGTTSSAIPYRTTEPATTPRKAYEVFRQAIRTRDYETCWRMMSANTRDAYEREAANLKMRVLNSETPPASDVDMLHTIGLTQKDLQKFNGRLALEAEMRRADARDPEAFEKLTRTEFDHERILGDQAKVYVRIDDQRQDEPMNVVREGGVWRVEMTLPVATVP